MSSTNRGSSLRPQTASLITKDLEKGKPDAVSGEVTRLMNQMKLKEKSMDEQLKEIATLKGTLAIAQRALAAKEKEAGAHKEKATELTGSSATSAKELEMAKADKKKLEAQVAEVMRLNAKLRDQMARAGDKSPGIAQQVALLQGQVRSARADADKAGEEARGLTALVRAKDKELDRMQKKVEEAAAVLARNGELENLVRELGKQLEDARADNKTLTHVNRTREGDIARLTKELDGLRATLSATQATLADTSAVQKAATNKATDLEAQVGLLRDDLARTGAVAARVAASEVRAGYKDEGTIPVMQHLEEVKYLNGEIGRLKDKVSSLEKQLSVSDELKERYRTASECGSQPGSRRVSSASVTAGDITQRSRRASAPGLPTGGAARALFAGLKGGAGGGILATVPQALNLNIGGGGPAAGGVTDRGGVPVPPRSAFGRAATPTSPRRRVSTSYAGAQLFAPAPAPAGGERPASPRKPGMSSGYGRPASPRKPGPATATAAATAAAAAPEPASPAATPTFSTQAKLSPRASAPLSPPTSAAASALTKPASPSPAKSAKPQAPAATGQEEGSKLPGQQVKAATPVAAAAAEAVAADGIAAEAAEGSAAAEGSVAAEGSAAAGGSVAADGLAAKAAEGGVAAGGCVSDAFAPVRASLNAAEVAVGKAAEVVGEAEAVTKRKPTTRAAARAAKKPAAATAAAAAAAAAAGGGGVAAKVGQPGTAVTAVAVTAVAAADDTADRVEECAVTAVAVTAVAVSPRPAESKVQGAGQQLGSTSPDAVTVKDTDA